MGRVFWITGLSGAGKTTIGKLFFDELRKKHINSIFLDGDTLREVFGNDLGYSKEDRLKCAMRYSRLCKMLEEQDIYVVICTISMFHTVREWNRANIENYTEIYVKVPIEVLNKRNQKNLYADTKAGIRMDVVGALEEFEEPLLPDVVLVNEGIKTPLEQAELLSEYCLQKT